MPKIRFRPPRTPLGGGAHDAPLDGWRGDTPSHTLPTRNQPTFGPGHASTQNSGQIYAYAIWERPVIIGYTVREIDLPWYRYTPVLIDWI